MGTDHKFVIDLPIRNEWANVELIRTSILNCFTAVFNDVDGCRALAMVVGELLENAIKYGAWSREERPFRLQVVGNDRESLVTVENPVDPGDAPAKDLTEALAFLKRFPTSEAAYRAKLLAVAAEPHNKEASGLGLARIAYEGNCELVAAVDGNFVRVQARVRY